MNHAKKFYRSMALAGTLVFLAAMAQAQSFHVLYNFSGCADGEYPLNTLLIDRSGNLYGSTAGGGSACGDSGNGVLFRLKRSGGGWIETPLHTFTGGTGDGSYPYNYGGLTFGPDGAIYGTTYEGGASNDGTVFSLRPPATACHSALCPWSETLLYSFSPPSGNPYSGVVVDSAGNLFGTSEYAIVYQFTPSGGSWSEISTQSTQIFANVTLGPDGNLYGVNYQGGFGYGTVFQLVPSGSGWTTNVLHSFIGADGANPVGGLVFDSAGNLYGSTTDFGPHDGGTVFELSLQSGLWVFKTIYAFSEGQGPYSALTLDSAGDLYGTTYGGGKSGNGIVFKLRPSGSGWIFTDLYDFFVNNDEGIAPVGGVTMDSSGNLYGTASRSGANGAGSVWEITP